MSLSVVLGFVPTGKPHPATKWSLLVALLVVVVLGIPKIASAGPPSVQAPTGAQSGGVFTGTYTFDTYIACSGGPNFNSSYSNSLEDTHTFAFYGAADGSLLVTIDGSGMMLITSCGAPSTGPHTQVASYVVSKDSTPSTPTPAPTPVPTATPTPVPPPAAGVTPVPPASNGGNRGRPAASATPNPVGTVATPTPTPIPESAVPAATSSPTAVAPIHPRPTQTPIPVRSATPGQQALGWAFGASVLVVFGLFVLWATRSRALHEHLHEAFTPLRLRLVPHIFKLRQAIKQRWHVHDRHVPKHRPLSPHHRTGKLVAHHHTSYPALVFLILYCTMAVASASISSQAANSLLSLTVSGPPPTTAATIDEPLDGERFASNNQTVRGTCPSGLLVEIFRNGSFAGSAQCDADGLYAILITLIPRQNDLIVKVSDALGQYGPDSTTVAVFYDPPPLPPAPIPTPAPSALAPSPTPVTSKPGQAVKSPVSGQKPTVAPTLLLDSDRHFYQGAEVKEPVHWDLTIEDGRAPYQVIWNWGDGDGTSSSTQAAEISQEHSYDKPGAYKAIVRVQDARGQEAVMQLVIVVNGTPLIGTASRSESGNLGFAWPMLTVTMLLVFSFWLGERHKLATMQFADNAS